MHDTLIPELIQKEEEETGEIITKENYLKRHQLTKLTMMTIYNWMEKFGFKYSNNKKLIMLMAMKSLRLLPIEKSMFYSISNLKYNVSDGYT